MHVLFYVELVNELDFYWGKRGSLLSVLCIRQSVMVLFAWVLLGVASLYWRCDWLLRVREVNEHTHTRSERMESEDIKDG